MKHVLPFILFSLLSTQLLAQGGNIQSITVSPQNPTVNDNVVVYVDVQFSSGDCQVDNQGLGLNGTDITAYGHHCVGALAFICNTTDTFELGQMAAGAYTFDFTLTSGAGGPGCSPGIIPDGNDQLQFVVTQTVGIDELESLDDFIYPNPFVDVLSFKFPLDESAVITDLNGKTMVEIDAGSNQVNLEEFPSGIYLFRIGRKVHKLVKQ